MSAGSTAAVKERLPAAVREEWAELAAPSGAGQVFDPASVSGLPEPARRWLLHAIAPGTALRRRVELEQHGRVRIGTWWPFRACEIIAPLEGYIWACTTRILGVPVHGYDRLVHGSGDMAHRVFARIPLVKVEGSNFVRSAAGRLVSEMIWAPAVALGPEVTWIPRNDTVATALLPFGGQTYEVDVSVGASGALEWVRMQRWASTDNGPYQLHPFGAQIHHEATFDGYTVAAQVTAGYHYENARWPRNAFITLTVDNATFL